MPQVGHLEANIKSKYADKPVKIGTIASTDYGIMDGEKVLKDAFLTHDVPK